MRQFLAGLVVVVLTASVAVGDEAPKTPAQQFNELRTELFKELPKTKDRAALFAKFSPRFLAFAEKNSKDATAIDALSLVLQMAHNGKIAKGSPAAKALALLEKDYAKDARVMQIVKLVTQRPDDAGLPLAKAVMAGAPDRKVQAKAVQAIIRGRESSIKTAKLIQTNEKAKEFYEKQRGEEFIKDLLASVPTYEKQIEEYKKVLASKYAGLVPDLSVGKMAPEIVSKDLDGKEVKLSQYRGKVVVLDIWATWCPPCRAMIPHERELVKRLEKRPFTLISISADAQKETLVNFIKKEPMPWVHWWNGASGGIIEDWEVTAFPTIYVLDHKGVIRYIGVRGEAMDKAVEALLKEIPDAKKVP